MKKITLDTKIISAAPIGTPIDRHFTDTVMKKLDDFQPATDKISQGNPVLRFFVQLRRMPKFAVMILSIAALTLLGGTVYAVYKILWEQPNVTITTPSANQFGRSQVVAQLERCGEQANQVVFEAKIGNTLDRDEISKILQARCEMEVIRTVIGESNGQIGADEVPAIGTSRSSAVMLYPAAGKVVKIDDVRLSLAGDHHAPSEALILNEQTQFVVDGALASRNQIRQGDTVLFVKSITTSDTTKQNDNGQYVTEGVPTSSEILYVIKPSLPFEYYNASKQSLIAQRQACIGNPEDSCIQTQQVDLYTRSVNRNKNERRSIQGVITKHNGSQLTLQSSSGRIFTITTPLDIVDDFNAHKSSLYNNIKISEGDLLQVNYYSDITTLTTKNIESIQLGLDVALKGDEIKKY